MADEIKTPGAEEEYQPDLMTLEDEDGNEVTFEVIDALDHKGVHYLAVVEYAENEDDVNDDAQLVILSVGEDDEGEYLDVVEDDETLLEVSKLFEKRLSDQFEIEKIPYFPDKLPGKTSCPARFVAVYMILLIIQRELGVLRWIADLPAMGRPWRLDEEA